MKVVLTFESFLYGKVKKKNERKMATREKRNFFFFFVVSPSRYEDMMLEVREILKVFTVFVCLKMMDELIKMSFLVHRCGVRPVGCGLGVGGGLRKYECQI